MKEININIEGYNVNGICVTCLNYNRKMFYHKYVKECFQVLAEIDVPDGLSVQVCWECLAKMKSALKFRTQILNAYDCLMTYSSKHTFLDSPSDLSSNAAECLSIVSVFNFDFGTPMSVEDDEDSKIKEEVDEKVEIDVEVPKLKEEEDVTEFDDSMPFSPSPIKDRESSDEDIQLSKLKNLKKKEKKKRGRKPKEKREDTEGTSERDVKKRKRLHLDLVDTYVMSEAEMWEVRERDRQSEQFKCMAHSCADCVLRFSCKRQAEVHSGKHKPCVCAREMWEVRERDRQSEQFKCMAHSCADCVLRFSCKRQAEVHSGKHKPRAGASQCDVCKGYFAPEHLATHRNLHLNGYRCQHCDFTSSMKKLMQLHVSKKHGVVPSLTCTECGSEFDTKSKFNYHKSQCCREKPQCDCCGKVFANKVTLRQHLKPSPPSESTKDKVFPCGHCDKVFYARKNYKAHIVVHEGVTYPCQICGKLFRWKRNLSRHTRNHRERDSGAAHCCRECGKTFASRDCLYNHLRLSKKHVNEKEYLHTCNYCGKKFATKWCMIDHIDWEHLKRIKYQCSICFKAFKTAKIMVAHMNNIHEGRNKKPEGEHLCEICGKSYKTVKRLKGHVWAMHTTRAQGRTYRCAHCPATFTWQTSIYKHVKMMHRNTPQPKQKKEEYPEIRAQYFQQTVLPMQPLGVPPL